MITFDDFRNSIIPTMYQYRVAKSGDKDFHSRFIAETKDWQSVKIFFLNFILRSWQTFSIDAGWGDIDAQSIFWILYLLSSWVLVSTCVWHRYLLIVTRLWNRNQIVSELSAPGHAYKYHTLIQSLSSAWNRRDDENLDLKSKSRLSFTLVECLTIRRIFFFPVKFHTNPFTVFRRMFVSSEKIICSQFVALLSWAHFKRFFRCTSISYGFDKSRLYLSSASFKRRCIILSLTVVSVFVNLFSMSRTVTNVCCSARETICSSYLWFVSRPWSIRSNWIT